MGHLAKNIITLFKISQRVKKFGSIVQFFSPFESASIRQATAKRNETAAKGSADIKLKMFVKQIWIPEILGNRQSFDVVFSICYFRRVFFGTPHNNVVPFIIISARIFKNTLRRYIFVTTYVLFLS